MHKKLTLNKETITNINDKVEWDRGYNTKNVLNCMSENVYFDGYNIYYGNNKLLISITIFKYEKFEFEN